MSEKTFEVAGHDYSCKSLSAVDAYDVARKWGYVFLNMAKNKDVTAQRFAQGFAAMTAPIPKLDNDFALDLCLSSVKRRLPGDKGWAPIYVDGQMRFADIDLVSMLEIVFAVVVHNRFIDFFTIAPSTSGAPEDGKEVGEA